MIRPSPNTAVRRLALGNKYEVHVYVKDPKLGYRYQEVHRGEWLIPALWHLFMQKQKHGAGCAKLELR